MSLTNNTNSGSILELEESFLQLLYYLAFHGEISKSSEATEYRKMFNLTKTDYDKDLEILVTSGYVRYGTFVSPEWHLIALVQLYRHHASWIDKFRDVGTYTRSQTAEFLSRIANLIVKDRFDEAACIPRPYVGLGGKTINLYPYIQPLFSEDARYMKLMKDEEFRGMTSEMLLEKFINDDIDKRTLQIVESNIPPHCKYVNDIKEEVSAYRYFINGEYSAPTTQGVCGLCLVAIHQLYTGDLDSALSLFAKAMKQQTNVKNAFGHPLLNYFYGIALYKDHKRSGDDKSTARLAAFKKQQAIRMGDDNILIRLLLDEIDSPAESATNNVETRIDTLLNRKDTPFHYSMCYIAAHFFGIKLQHEGVYHSARIIQHEMSKWLPIGSEGRSELMLIYGGKAVVSTLRRKESWEMMLEDVSKVMAKDVKEEKRRVAYYVQDHNIQSIEEQVLGKTGEWRNTKLLSLTQMTLSGYDCMDATDVMIASALAHSTDETEIEILVAHLRDTDRLYIGQSYDGRAVQAVVHQDNPKLVFSGSGTTILVTTNCKTSERGDVMKNTVRQDGNDSFTLVTVNPLQKDIMNKILRQGVFPSSAILGLRNMMNSLQGVIDVVDNIPDDVLEVTETSKGVIAVRIVPEKDEFLITLRSIAMDNGLQRFVPAEGDELVFDEEDGMARCIRRDMEKEYENLQQINNLIRNMGNAEVMSYTDSKIWMKEDLLKLIVFVSENRDRFLIEWPEGRALKLLGTVSKADITVNVESDKEWFTVDGEVRNNNLHLTLNALVSACSNSDIEGFVKLSDDEYVRMSEKLKRHIAAMETLLHRSSESLTVPKFQVGALASIIKGLNVNLDAKYREFEQKTKEAYAIDPDVPDGLNATLRGYQKDGFRWMCRLSEWGAGACLADDMGLGKTIQAIAFLLHKSADGPSLVVAPKSVVPNWVSELMKFAPSLNIINLSTETRRQKAVSGAGKGDVVMCTYGLMASQAQTIIRKDWNVVCLDEAHQIKNRTTMVSKAAMEIKAANRIIMTGTPLQNNLGELWNLFQFINPGLLGDWSVFRDSFMVSGLDERHRELLKDMTTPFVLRRTKEDVLAELPEKIVHQHMVELTEDEMKVYEEMRRMAEVKFKKYKTRKERAEAKELKLQFFTELTKLRLASCSMKLVHERWSEESSKITELMQILGNLMSNPDNNILIFSQFTSFLEMIKPRLRERNMEFLYLDGQTPLDKRREYVDDFQNNRCRLFLSSLKAGGLGINLTRANYVILLDPWWNPAIENQAMDRAHRLGQQRVVTVIRLVSEQTIEEKITRLHEEKQHLSDEILEGTGESHKLTYEDIMDMVSPF